MSKNSEMYKFAEHELDLLLELERKDNLNTPIGELEHEFELFGGMTMQESINNDILTLIEAIPSGHSGGSFSYLLHCFNELVKFHNLTPLTLEDNEFVEVARDGDEIIYQNTRNFEVFKTTKKGVYHLNGKDALLRACGKCPEEEAENEQNNIN